jgi:hypothetical protein
LQKRFPAGICNVVKFLEFSVFGDFRKVNVSVGQQFPDGGLDAAHAAAEHEIHAFVNALTQLIDGSAG